MATAKKKTTEVATTVPNVALPANYAEMKEARKAAFMQKMAANTGESNKITVTQDKKFKVPVDGDSEKVDTINGIIVAIMARKNWYDSQFDRDNPVPPNCFAIGEDSFDALSPSGNSPEPQASSCATCALNKFEKMANGKFKAKECKDSFRLALVAPGQDKLMMLDISATAVKPFGDYIKAIFKSGRDYNEVVTEFSFDAGSEYPSIRCRESGSVPEKHMGMIVSLTDEAVGLISREPDVTEFQEKVVAKRLPAPKKRRAA